uniref:Putative secreted protein n=1 Tax=Ixodes ricinus TaxID=34613 RepID=V5GL62_IXORI
MKATIAVLCFIAAIAYSVGRLSEQQCRSPVPSSLCAPNAKPRKVWFFSNFTSKCESNDELWRRYKSTLKGKTS